MHVLELIRPGTWLSGFEANPEIERDVRSLLGLLEDCIGDAAVSLSLLDEVRSSPRPPRDPLAEFEADSVRLRAVETELSEMVPPDVNVSEVARHEAKRRKWADGYVPDEYAVRIPFIYASAYVYALDTLRKALAHLSKINGVPEAVREVLTDFDDAFGDLTDVRDSSHHREDRVQGKARSRRIEVEGGILVGQGLAGNQLVSTTADGRHGQVEVSLDGLRAARECVQRVLDSFVWSGPMIQRPR